MVHEIENFFGCYLLYCTNPRYKGHTYIGFTVDPNRRIKQHNEGSSAGGAKRTSGKGPWDMVLIIHGFPNHITALRFEWAWQHPKESRRINSIRYKKKSETPYEYKLFVVSNMLRTAPWGRLPLTVQWLKQEYRKEFQPDLQPPIHMPLCYGPVESVKVKSPKKKAQSEEPDSLTTLSKKTQRCQVCGVRLKEEDSTIKCVHHPGCRMEAHTLCLSKAFLVNTDDVLPVDGACPGCHKMVLWGDLIRYKRGCYQKTKEVDDHDDHWADELATQI